MSRLELYFLGPPQVRCGGRTLDFPTRKALALLIYLVVEGGIQPREKLATLFWPESPASRSRATLRNTLSQLRSTLSEAVGQDPPPQLHIERDALGFDRDADFALDLQLVEAAYEGLRSASGAEVASLRAAVEAYRGDFMEGFSLGDAFEFDDWATLQRELWHRRLDDVLDHLSRRYVQRGATTRAAEVLQRWIAHAPLNEIPYRRLMRLQLSEGNRGAALQVFETCRETLETELGVAPSAETEAVAARARRQALPAEFAPPRVDRRGAAPPPAFSQGPFVGRAQEYEKLVTCFQGAARGRPHAVAIVGQAGIGKTRLAREFLGWAAAQGAEILQGHGFETGGRLPYQPLVEALRPCVERENAPEDLLSDTWLVELARLLPELRERYPDLGSPERDESTARTRLLEALARLTQALAKRRPLVLFLDDVQWADATSLDVLQYLGRRWRERGVPALLLLTLRSEALHPTTAAPTSELANWLTGLERALPLTRLRLAALAPDDVRRFVQPFAPESADAIGTWLYQETGGQPFYLTETLEDLRDRELLTLYQDDRGAWRIDFRTGLLTSQPGSGVGVPDRVRQVIVARLGRLGPTAFALLVAGAVLEERLDFDLMCAVAGVGEDAGLSAFDELLRVQLLRERAEAGGAAETPYAFAHDKIRDVVYTEAGDARRRVFHRRALAALEAADAPPGELAHHALAAGRWEVAFRHSLAAGEGALGLFAAREAIAHYEQARRLLQEIAAPGMLSHLGPLYLQLGRAYELDGDYDRALAVYAELEQLAQERGDRPLELNALLARTTVYAAPTQHYDPTLADVLSQQALPLARELEDHAAQAKILWNLMLLNLFTGDTRQALRDGEASLALARRHDLREQLAYTLHDLYRAYFATGQAEKGLASLREAQELWRELDNQAMLADGLAVEASLLILAGRYDQGLALCGEAFQISQAIDNLWNQSFSQFTEALVLFERAEFDRAFEIMQSSVRLGQQAGFMIPAVHLTALMGWMYGLLGEYERGLEQVEASLAQAERMHENLKAEPLAVSGLLHTFAGRLEEAEKALEKTGALYNPEANDYGVAFVPLAMSRLALAKGEQARAFETAGDALEILEARGIRFLKADFMYVQGRALWAQGDSDRAGALLSRARAEAEALGARRILWRILAALSELEAGRGNSEAAATLRGEARRVVERIGDGISDPRLKESFLDTAPVRRLMGEERRIEHKS